MPFLRMRLRLGTHGLYCVTKGSISLCALVFSLRDIFLSENLTSESVYLEGCSGSLSLEGVVSFFMFFVKVSSEELVVSSLRPSTLHEGFCGPGRVTGFKVRVLECFSRFKISGRVKDRFLSWQISFLCKCMY